MLSLSNLTYKIGARTILDECTLNIMNGWKVGVVGPNGAGKSTLFKLIAGELQAAGGSVSMPTRQRIAWVRQDIPETDTPLLDMVLNAHEEMAQLWQDAQTETDPDKLGDIYHRLDALDAYAAPAKAATLLTGLGFQESQLSEPFSSFSGGWRMRVALASVLFLEPEFLLLDEPTNHLDLEAIMWLENYLASYPHTMLVISHDRELLNKCTDHIVHVDKQKLTLYTGNYDTFEQERAARLGLQQKMFEKQQAQRAHMQSFVDRFRAKASKASQAQSRIKALEKMDLVDAVIADRAVAFTFPNPDKINSPMLSMNHVDIGYSVDKPVLRRLNDNIDFDDRIALLGANGNGKSTLIKLIAGKLDPLKGDMVRSSKLRIGYFSQHQTEELDMDSTPYLEMMKLMRQKQSNVSESAARAKLGAFGFSRDLADNAISALSGGEKARLLFAFMSFDAPHLLLLDEPTNHLDIDAREALVQALNNYEGAIVIVSHDPTMVERVADRLWLVKDGECRDFNGDLEDYRKFTIQARRDARKKERAQKNKEDEPTTAEQHEPAPAASVKDAPRKLSFAEKRKVEQAEKDVSSLTKEKERLEQLMASPDFYNGHHDVVATQKLYQDITHQLSTAEALWLELVA
jgi:ATP-binding cassette subfamily F protein 3